MLRLLHTADWQIGRRYPQFATDDAVPLAEARIAAVERLARLATERGCHAVLVAGDVFDAQTVSARTIRRLMNALAGFAGPWVMIPGNHDAALAESVWSHAARLAPLPANLHLALAPGVVDLPAQRLSVLAAPLVQRHTYGDLTEWFDTADTPSGHWRVGLAHGCVQGVLAEEIDSPNPIAPQRAERARLDYLALGDWHGCRRIDERTWYSGTPEPDRFKDNDAGHALLVELDAPGAAPRIERVATGAHTWHARSARIEMASDVDALLAWLATLGPRDVVTLSVTGRCDLAQTHRVRAAIDAASAQARCLVAELDGLRLAPTDDDIAALQADGYLGDVIGALRDRQAVHADETAADALALLAAMLQERRAAPVAARALDDATPSPVPARAVAHAPSGAPA